MESKAMNVNPIILRVSKQASEFIGHVQSSLGKVAAKLINYTTWIHKMGRLVIVSCKDKSFVMQFVHFKGRFERCSDYKINIYITTALIPIILKSRCSTSR